ncbi:glycosyltransferase [Hallerella porci]|nr:glycosyltransferase [Hallerella porci]
MTKFCMDLMIQQKKDGNEVALIWPGQMNFLFKEVSIKKQYPQFGILSFEIVNPLPVSFDEGILDINEFTKSTNSSCFKKFLEQEKPDVIHVHTFMGLHREFLEEAQKLKIRLVFSVHDFFAVCPKVTLFRNGQVCSKATDCTLCEHCNKSALSLNKIKILQSPVYRFLKDSPLVKKIRKGHRDNYFKEENNYTDTWIATEQSSIRYKTLRNYYGSMIDLFDSIHYNSTLTKNVFEKFFIPKNTCIIPITHSSIKDNRKIKTFNDCLRITYLGPQNGAKGYFLLKECLDGLYKERQNFTLNIFFTPIDAAPYMNIHGRYTYDQLEQIFDETDVLVAPSIWYETFGYTVLEALSFGAPVITSENVGAKDIFDSKCGIVVKNFSCDTLKNTIKQLNSRQLQEMNSNIMSAINIDSISVMTKKIHDLCYKEN